MASPAEDVRVCLPNGLVLEGLAWGPVGSKCRVLALHGWLDNCATWHLVAPALAAGGARVVALDFAGHGRSAHRSSDASYLGLSYAEDTAAAIVALGWGGASFGAGRAGSGEPEQLAAAEGASSATAEQARLVILGHSMGAGVGALVAGSVPEGTVAGLVMVESVGFMSEEAAGLPVRMRRALVEAAARAVASADASRAGPRRGGRVYKSLQEAAEARQANARAIGGQRISAEAALALATRGVVRASGRDGDGGAADAGVTFAHDRRAQLPSPLYLTESQVQAFFAATRCPVLVLRAKDGLAFPEERVASRMAAFAGDARQQLVPGHHHMHADPDTAKAVADAVLGFLADHAGLSAPPAAST
ncbi:hypothetical protein FNF29_04638 [Cafeteria roenbergensis]|uniref:AB hydrolase-1 domain-containing protein n=1 Tax=Cafeteria roenbergensis TaxID=33653 RepID=A0A5A8CH28_CAFRO|nr:hypothetical protein FNF29_04638 [Cafeteria roenbergensis]|eukprot:KAA0151430.1 hypothetical protein FNF29_04638 [Cafeteria roenbergensis]